MAEEIRVRFAPSPTGPLHLGGARTALFNWLFARQRNGQFVLRIEDTDIERSEKRYEADIMDGLLWLGLEWDEGPDFAGTTAKSGMQSENRKTQNYTGNYGPYRQSERGLVYKKYLNRLLDEKKAYYCYCTKEELEAERQAMLAQGVPPKYSGHCRNLEQPPAGRQPQLIRFKTPEGEISFQDIIRNKVIFKAEQFGDLAIAKDLESPLFNFAGVVDDYEMKITHVIRGEDHLSNTPKQIIFQKALGFPRPEYAHLPLILSPDRSKLSKRYADTALLEYRQSGYLPEAMINFMALLGWHPKDDREIFNLDELIKEFNLNRVQKAGAAFNQEKLGWLNNHYIKNSEVEELLISLRPILKQKGLLADKVKEGFVKKIIELEKERMKTLADFWNLADFFFYLPDYDPKILNWQEADPSQTTGVLKSIAVIFQKIEADKFIASRLRDALENLIAAESRGVVLWSLRAAISGKTASPDPLVIGEILGKEEIIKRINIAVEKLNG